MLHNFNDGDIAKSITYNDELRNVTVARYKISLEKTAVSIQVGHIHSNVVLRREYYIVYSTPPFNKLI